DRRDGPGIRGARRAPPDAANRLVAGDRPGRGEPGPGRPATGLGRSTGTCPRAGRGPVPEHPDATERPPLPGDRGRPRGDPGHDRSAGYRVRVTYAGDNFRVRLRLDADGHEVHPLMTKPDPVRPVEFDVPAVATADGDLTLRFAPEPGRGGNGRGCQVAEVWL